MRHSLSLSCLWVTLGAVLFVAGNASHPGQMHPSPRRVRPGDRATQGLVSPVRTAGRSLSNTTSRRPIGVDVGVGQGNAPGSGGLSLNVVGGNLGFTDRSPAVRTGSTACRATTWISMTSMACQTASAASRKGAGQNMDGAVQVTIASQPVARPVTGVFTYDTASASATSFANQPAVSAGASILHGANLGEWDFTKQSRFSNTGSEAMTWTSDTAISCTVSRSGGASGGSGQVAVTSGIYARSVSELFSYDNPVSLGNEYAAWTYAGYVGYNPDFLPDIACSDGSAEEIFSPGVYGCAGSWGPATMGVVSAGSSLCGVGYVTCPSRDHLTQLGLNESCSLPGSDFYASAESSINGSDCTSDGANGQGPGMSALWGCTRGTSMESPEGVGFFRESCGPLDHKVTGIGAHGAWNVSEGLVGQEKSHIQKSDGNGGLMCCRAAVSLPVGNLGQGINCNDSSTGSGYIMYTQHSAQKRFGAGSNNAEHFVCVQYGSGTGWKYLGDHATIPFTPDLLDTLIAAVEFETRHVSHLQAAVGHSSFQGISSGYVAGDLTVVPDEFNGLPDPGEFTVLGASVAVSPDSRDMRRIVSDIGRLHAHYTVDSWRLGKGSQWLDASGNGFHGNITHGSPTESFEVGNGANSPVRFVRGSVSDSVQFPDALPSNYTVCGVSRYTGQTNRNRVLDGMDGDWFLGHDKGLAGVLGLGLNASVEFKAVNRVWPSSDWVITCAQNEDPSAVVVNGMRVSGTSKILGGLNGSAAIAHNATNGTKLQVKNSSGISINDGASGENSDWAVMEIAIWSEALSFEQILAVSDHYRGFLSLGTSIFEQLWEIAGATYSNKHVSDSAQITLAGSNFGASDQTLSSRRGSTDCQKTDWIAATSMRCVRSIGVGSTKSVVVTSGSNVGSISSGASFDIATLQIVVPANSISTGSNSFTVIGSGFSLVSQSVAVAVAGTSCEGVQWISNSETRARISNGAGATFRLALTMGETVATGSGAHSYDSSQLLCGGSNHPFTGSISLTMLGNSFVTSDYSEMVRFASQSGAESTKWASGTSLTCQTVGGVLSTQQIALSVGQQTSSTTEAHSMDLVSISSVLVANAPSTGASPVRVSGSRLLQANVSPSLRIGLTGAESTFWTSETSIQGAGTSSSRSALRVTFTVGNLPPGTMTGASTYDDISVSSTAPANAVTMGSTRFTVSGSGLGWMQHSLRPTSSISGTSAEASDWISESSVMTKRMPGVGFSGRLTLTQNTASRGSLSRAVTYDTLVVSSTTSSNMPPAGSFSFTFSGQGMGLTDSSSIARAASTAAESSEWSSDSSMQCRSRGGGVAGSLRIQMTATARAGSLTVVLSFSSAVVESVVMPVTNETNSTIMSMAISNLVSGTGSHSLTLWGGVFGLSSHSIAGRVGVTGTEATEWASQSMMTCMISQGVSGSMLHLGLTVSSRSGSVASLLIYGASAVSTSLKSNTVSWSGAVSSTIHGMGLGLSGATAAARVVGSGAESSEWSSESSLSCRSASTVGTKRVSTTIDQRSGSMTVALSSDLVILSSAMQWNSAGGKGSVSLVAIGKGMTAPSYTEAMRVGLTGAEASEWKSDSSMQCLAARASGQRTMSAVVTSGGRVQSVTALLSHDRTSVSSVTRSNLAGLGSSTISMIGSIMGSLLRSVAIQAGGSGAEASEWKSDSSMQGRSSVSGVAGSLRIQMTSGMQVKSMTHVLSYSPPVISSASPANGAFNSSSVVSIFGLSLGSLDSTAPSRLLHSSCESTAWYSTSNVVCSGLTGSMSSVGLMISVGSLSGSHSESFSYDLGLVSGVSGVPVLASGEDKVDISVSLGSGSQIDFSNAVQLTVIARFGHTSCEASEWASGSSVLCISGSGVGFNKKVVFTSGSRTLSVASAEMYEAPKLALGRRVGESGDEYLLLINGTNFGSGDYTASGQLQHANCTTVKWTSDSGVTCQVSAPSHDTIPWYNDTCPGGYVRNDWNISITVGEQESNTSTVYACLQCEANVVCSGNIKEACPANSTAPKGSGSFADCICLAGYSGPNGGPCEPCEAGTYKGTNGSDECSLCSAGKFSSGVGELLEATCQDCPDNMTSTNGSANCTYVCPGRFYLDSTSTNDMYSPSSLYSQNGLYELRLPDLDHVQVYETGPPEYLLWDSRTDPLPSIYSPGAVSLPMRFRIDAADGHLLLTDSLGTIMWRNEINGIWADASNPARLILRNDGALVVYDQTGTQQWQTNSSNTSLVTCTENGFDCSDGSRIDACICGYTPSTISPINFNCQPCAAGKYKANVGTLACEDAPW